MRLCYKFGNYMECISFCDVLIEKLILNYVLWFTVKVRKFAVGHIHNLSYYFSVRFWTVFMSLQKQQVIYVNRQLISLDIIIEFNINFRSDSLSQYINNPNLIILIPISSLSLASFI